MRMSGPIKNKRHDNIPYREYDGETKIAFLSHVQEGLSFDNTQEYYIVPCSKNHLYANNINTACIQYTKQPHDGGYCEVVIRVEYALGNTRSCGLGLLYRREMVCFCSTHLMRRAYL